MADFDLAPYPKREVDVTADAMARHCAVLAQRRLVRLLKPGQGAQQNAIEVLGYVHEFALAGLLRSFVAADRVHADEAARAVWRALNAGEMSGEQLWDWLVEYGIDPNLIDGEA